MFPKLEPLLKYLDSLTAKGDLKILHNLLSETDITLEDIEPACIFSDKTYARNKVKSSAWYDLYIMCWKNGQSSAVHDHNGSSCGFRIITGVATETQCTRTKGDLVRPVKTVIYKKGDLCLAHDGDIHQIVNNQDSGSDLVTLHTYSPPLKMSYYSFDPAYSHEPFVMDNGSQQQVSGMKS